MGISFSDFGFSWILLALGNTIDLLLIERDVSLIRNRYLYEPDDVSAQRLVWGTCIEFTL